MYQTFYRLRSEPDDTTLSQHEIGLTIQIAEALRAAGGRALIVGGYVRDVVMHKVLATRLQSKDVDIEVYGMQTDALRKLLEPIHHVSSVGASFGVLKVGPLDVSLPRRDSKTGRGHRGFVIEADPQLDHRQDPLTGELFDEHGGVEDIRRRLLRMVDPLTFSEDPLRALRAMQFAGRFGFQIESKTASLIRQLDLHELSAERIGQEWTKLLLKSERPSLGMVAALDLGIIKALHPELYALVTTEQEPAWHPEGSVWNHTCMAADMAARIVRRESLGHDRALTVMLAALCHDLGKPVTTARDEATGRIRSPEHAREGVEISRRFMRRLHVPLRISRKVQRIVFDHMFLPEAERAKDAAIRRLAKRLQPATVQELIWVTEADFCGRTLENPDLSLIRLFQKRAEELAVAESAEEPLILGRDLITLGIAPGQEMGRLLKELEAAQINGAFGNREDGLEYYRQHLAPPGKMT
jgi:tRNA nucleotidyltransferase (CCA-adding enzyme)